MLPGSEPGLSIELSYIDPIVEQFGIEPSHRRQLTEEAHRRWINDAPGLPFQILHPALCDLPNVCAEQEVRVVVSGMFADEVCGERKRLHDWAMHTSARALVTGAPLPFGRRDYLRWARRRLQRAIGHPRIDFMDLDEWVPGPVEAEFQDWIADQKRALARDRRPLGELAARADADAWVAMYWEGTSPLGARPLLPFFNREVARARVSLPSPRPPRPREEAAAEGCSSRRRARAEPDARGQGGVDRPQRRSLGARWRASSRRRGPREAGLAGGPAAPTSPFMEGTRLTASPARRPVSGASQRHRRGDVIVCAPGKVGICSRKGLPKEGPSE